MPATDALVEGEIGSVEESSPGQHHPSTLSCAFVLRQRTYQAKLAGLGQIESPSNDLQIFTTHARPRVYDRFVTK